jgi:threonine dehydratase
MNDPLKQTLLARVYDVAKETPLQRAAKLSNQTGAEIYLKREDLQPVHSFKLRGAYNKISQLSPAEREKGVITASAGNHAQGVALAAKKLGLSAQIVMPTTTPPIKVEAVKSYGAEVVLLGDNYSDAYEHSLELARKSGRVFVHPFDDPDVITGQGTIAREILEQLPDTTHIFVPVGGGGLIAGIAQFVKGIRPDIKVIGVEPEDSNAMQASLKAGKRVTLDHVGIFADGVAVKQVGKLTFEIAQKCVDEVITVNTDQICAAIKSLFEDTRSIVEPAGALATAGIQQYDLPKDAKAVAICSGANVTFERLQQIAERTLIGSGREALFAVQMPEKPGALRSFVTDVVNGHSITEFNYRLNKRQAAHVLVGISVANNQDKLDFMKKASNLGYEHIDLSGDDIAKEHVRHMVGGPAEQAESERLYQIDFPERPGALGDFLAAIGTGWNISAFHYRNAASDSGNVLIGFEADNPSELEEKLAQTGYDWQSVGDNKSLKIFIM